MKQLAILIGAISASLGAIFGLQLHPASTHPVYSASVPNHGAESDNDRDFRPQPIGHPSFMSPHAAPMVVHQSTVFAVNTPADTVDVIDLKSKQVTHRVSVGIDPVSIAIRPGGKEVWVSNHVSDSVSIIDTDDDSPTYLQVIATIQEFDRETRATRFDEPVGIAFANAQKAYVALSSENQIAVIDATTRKITRRLKIPAQEPRHIVARDGRLYVIPFESNNQTQLSGGDRDEIDGDRITFDAWEHSIRHNNVLSLGHVVDIIKHSEVPDRDLFVFDTSTDKLIHSSDSLGTLLYGMAVDSQGQVFIAQTDARNDVNGRSGTQDHSLKELQNRAFLNRVTRVRLRDTQDVSNASTKPSEPNPNSPTAIRADIAFFDLEPTPPKQPQPEDAIATPFGVALDADEQHLFVTSAGSNKLVSLDADSGKIVGSVAVGSVPRGVVMADDSKLACVFNAVGNSVSLVDISKPDSLKVDCTIELADPTDPRLKAGRKVFNSAAASTTGTFSCASCHPDGHTDQLLWVLKTPVVSGGDQIMPRSTMPIRGLRETEPFHWDGIPGDPYGGNNSANVHRHVEPNCDAVPESATRHLIDGALASTMALVGDSSVNDEKKPGKLSKGERDQLAKFLLAVPYPPAPKRPFTNELSTQAKRGFELFHIEGDDDPSKVNHNVCGDCHRMPNWVSTNTPGTGMDAPTWRGAYDRWLILPQGRLNLVAFPFFKRVAENGLDERSIWQFSWGGRRRFDPVWNMVLEGSTGWSGTFGRQVTLNQDSAGDSQTRDLLAAMEQAALESSVIIQGDGVLLADTPQSVTFQFDPNDKPGKYVSINHKNRPEEPTSYTSMELLELATTGDFVGTFTAHVGEGQGYDHPQPVIWTAGPIEKQRGHQKFPYLYAGKLEMKISGRHIAPDASLIVNGRRTEGEINVDWETITIRLKALPESGTHMLQIHNPNGQFSNDFIFHVTANEEDAKKMEERFQQNRTGTRLALITAVTNDNLAQVQRWAKRRSLINARHPENGSTPLSAAALRGNLEIVKELVKNGANVNRTNRDGNSPLHVATFLCRFDVVKYLLKNGASITAKNQRQDSPIDVVSGQWSEGLGQFYQLIASGSGFEVDLEAIKRDRKKMHTLLKEWGQ